MKSIGVRSSTCIEFNKVNTEDPQLVIMQEYQNRKIFLQKVVDQNDLKKFFVIKRHRHMLLLIFMEKKLLEIFVKKNWKKNKIKNKNKNKKKKFKKKFKIEIVIRRKSDKRFDDQFNRQIDFSIVFCKFYVLRLIIKIRFFLTCRSWFVGMNVKPMLFGLSGIAYFNWRRRVKNALPINSLHA